MQVQELVGIIPWTFVAQICNLFIQMYLIKRFLFKPVTRYWKNDARLQMRKSYRQRRQKRKRRQFVQNMNEICRTQDKRPNEILDSARNTAAIQSEKILKEAQDQTFAMKNKAEKEIAQEKKKAVNEVKGEIGDMAVEIAGKVIEREINEKDHEKLIDEFISNVGEVL